MATPIFSEITVKLVGEDSNAFIMVSRTRKAIEQAGHREEAKEFFDKALSGNYDFVLTTIQEYVNVE